MTPDPPRPTHAHSASTTPSVSSSRAQVAALVSLRWRMVRRRRVRAGILTLAGLVGVVAAVAASGVVSLPTSVKDQTEAVLPSALAGFLLLCVLAPIAAGGGFELIPADQLSAFPVRHRTVMAASLLLVPLNVAWLLLTLSLVAATASTLGRGGPPVAALLTVACYVCAATVVGHAVAWGVVGLRRRRSGRLLLWAAVAVAAATAVTVVASGGVEDVLLSLPTMALVDGMRSWQEGAPLVGVAWIVALVLVAAVAWWVGVRVCGWALHRTGDLAGTDPAARPVRRVTARADAADVPGLPTLLRRSERNGVLRSAPLRRGLAVIVLLPAAASSLAALPWDSLVLLPPLVASGAALLYGVNAFALEGSGALFLAAAPLPHRLWLQAKARVVLEVVTLAVLVATVTGALRAGWPTPLSALAVAGSAASCSLLVTSTCLHLSVTRPHRADLRGPRDTPAPPGTMALYSARLATATTMVGVCYAVAAMVASWRLLALVTLASVAVAARTWWRTRRRWEDPGIRARVIATVAAG